MATAAFKSTTRRSAVAGGGGAREDAGSSTRHRRWRSLSRCSGRFPVQPSEDGTGEERPPAPRGRFVNTVRGSGFPEISLDDLADEFFRAKYEEAEEEEESRRRPAVWERLGRRRESDISPMMAAREEAERRRGRSVSRYNGSGAVEKKGILENDGGCKGISDGRMRRQRSVSAARPRFSDSENDMDFSHSSSTRAKSRGSGNGNSKQPSFCRPTTSSVLRRSASQKDLLQSHDNYSSQSSLTDDEAQEVHSTRSGTEKTIQAVYAKKTEHPTGDGDGDGSGLYEAMRKEVKHAVEEIRMELEKVMVKAEPTSMVNDGDNQLKGSDVIKTIADFRKNYTSKLEQSEKRRQDLLAELAVEEQRGQELTKIVRGLLPAPKQTAAPERQSRSRRSSSDRNRVSKHLTEEAEKYFEDFLSNVEDTDMSSYDGERSDTSSTIGGSRKLKDSLIHPLPETHGTSTKAGSLPAETDGVVLPWLQWETSNDISPSPCKSSAGPPLNSGEKIFSPVQGTSAASHSINHIMSSHGSWSPVVKGHCSAASREVAGSSLGDVGRLMSSCSISNSKGTSFNMDDYAHLKHNDDLLLEMWRQRQRIESGSLLLCGRTCI